MTPLRAAQGMTLIEVLVSLSVFALIAAGVAAGTVSTIHGNVASRDTTVAAALIQDKLEQLRALDPAANPGDLAPGAHVDPLNPITELGRRGGAFTRTWTVLADSPRAGLSEVTVTVSWSDPVRRTLRNATFVCRSATCS